ncbi:hypothetical protein C2G38_2150436, partial [Gigaspora rosea]
MEDDNLEYYYSSDYETMHIDWKQEMSKPKRLYKRKQPSFIWDYFEKDIDSMGEEVRICKILDESGQRCNQKYKNVGSSTGNLIVHLRDEHGIVSQDDIEVSKK